MTTWINRHVSNRKRESRPKQSRPLFLICMFAAGQLLAVDAPFLLPPRRNASTPVNRNSGLASYVLGQWPGVNDLLTAVKSLLDSHLGLGSCLVLSCTCGLTLSEYDTRGGSLLPPGPVMSSLPLSWHRASRGRPFSFTSPEKKVIR